MVGGCHRLGWGTWVPVPLSHHLGTEGTGCQRPAPQSSQSVSRREALDGRHSDLGLSSLPPPPKQRGLAPALSSDYIDSPDLPSSPPLFSLSRDTCEILDLDDLYVVYNSPRPAPFVRPSCS